MISKLFKRLRAAIALRYGNCVADQALDSHLDNQHPGYFERNQHAAAMEYCKGVIDQRFRKLCARGDLIVISAPDEIEMASNFVCALSTDQTLLFLHSTPFAVQPSADCELIKRLVTRYLRYYVLVVTSHERLYR